MLSTARRENRPRPCAIKNSGEEAKKRMQDVPPGMKQRMPSSRVLEEVIRQAPAEYVTVGWLTSTLPQHSFGIIMLSLGLLATTPLGSTVPGLILAVMAVQLIFCCTAPVFPHFFITRRFSNKQIRLVCWVGVHCFV